MLCYGLTSKSTYCDHKYTILSSLQASCTENGNIIYHCNLCDSDKKETIYSKVHTISHGQCTVCQFIDTETEEGYKLSCEEADYKDICRTPDDYKGKSIYFEGKVFQNDGNMYLIEVTESEYGLWEDIVYVSYSLPKGASKILVDDIVIFYGECKGEKEYVTVLLSNNTVPYVKAKYIDIISE